MKNLTLNKSLLILSITLLSSISIAQEVDFSGEWRPLFHEDAPERGPGPHFGDFTAMPINDEARMRGESYQPDRISVVTEYICRPHGADYSMRGLSYMRVQRETDPRSQQVVAFKTRMGWNNMERTIWLDGRAHPPAGTAHTFQGFSTGVWNGNILTITTTHLKESYHRRNGIPSSSERTFTEHWMLHDNYLTVVTVIDDPVFFTEPLVRTQDWVYDPSFRIDFFNCDYSEELPINPDNLVPNYLPGENPYLTEFAENYRLPMKGVSGGAETMYPEFRKNMGPLIGDAQFCSTEECD